jgi:hypothetical protein
MLAGYKFEGWNSGMGTHGGKADNLGKRERGKKMENPRASKTEACGIRTLPMAKARHLDAD